MPALRRAAPRLTRELFQCSHHRPSSLGFRPSAVPQLYSKPLNARGFKSSPRRVSVAVVDAFESRAQANSAANPLTKPLDAGRTKSKAKFFATTSEKSVAYWLLGSAASVFGIVVFGGLTRLTESGYVDHSVVEVHGH